ncbi:hypothetical protein JCM5353_001123 [Sporobolomyces roseus]
MPSSPPPAAPLQPPFSSVLVDTANATDDELLHLIENARAAVERARDVTESFSAAQRREQEEEEEEELQPDTAAESLFERHTNRRDMELEWDERDTERRARSLIDRLRQNPVPEPLVDFGDHDSESEDELMLGNERYPVGEVHHIGGGYSRVAGGALSGGDMFGLPTFGRGIIEDSDEDDDDDSYVETGEEAIFGFDGDGVDEELEEAAWHYEQEMRRYEDSTTDSTAPRLTSIWPGLLGEQPLNPSRPAAPPAVTSSQTHSQSLAPLDPSSSTSFTSFLAPGATFIGEQVTSRSGNPRRPAEGIATRNSQTSNRSRRQMAPAQSASSSSNVQATTAHPAFAPLPTLSTSQSSPSTQDLASSAPSSSSSPFHRSADPAQAFLLGPLRPTSSSSSNQVNPTTDRSSSSRYAPYSSSHAAVVVPPATSSASTPLQAPIPPNLTPVERARMSIARNNNPAARTNPESWREVGRELLGRSGRGEESMNGGRVPSARIGPGIADERWGVQVVIHSYDPSAACLTGFMNAYGIQSTHRNPATHPARVTTFFSATILHPLKSGLFLSPSLTGSGGTSAEGLKVSQSTEAESWIQLGPFKGVSKNELLRLAKDRQWVEDMTSGWLLMRWKEREFINVKATESTLSINGFYFVALNRSTGVIEGLYNDPHSATPYQRLDLSPSSPDGAFSLATYEMC